MKTLKLLYSVPVLLALSSCDRGEMETSGPMDPDAPEWLLDESLPVPINFGVGTVVSATTKTDYSVEPEGFFTSYNFRYGVLALDQYDEAHPSVNGVEAYNAPTSLIMDGIAGYKTQFVDRGGERTHYYPVKSDRNYTFYAYHINNLLDQDYAPGTDNTITGIALGDCDIVWAKAEAVYFNGHSGYNAAYIRALMNNGGDYNYYYLNDSHAPRFQFGHLTSRFRFWVQAVDDVDGSYAEETMDGKVKITGISVSGVKKTADLSIKTGTLSGEVLPEDNTIAVNRDGTAPFCPKRLGGYWGDPLFILPNDLLAESAITMTLTIQYLSPSTSDGDGTWNTASYDIPLRNTSGGSEAAFEPGVSYQFQINLKSYENIEISTSVQPWDDVEITDDSFIIG